MNSVYNTNSQSKPDKKPI